MGPNLALGEGRTRIQEKDTRRHATTITTILLSRIKSKLYAATLIQQTHSLSKSHAQSVPLYTRDLICKMQS